MIEIFDAIWLWKVKAKFKPAGFDKEWRDVELMFAGNPVDNYGLSPVKAFLKSFFGDNQDVHIQSVEHIGSVWVQGFLKADAKARVANGEPDAHNPTKLSW